MKAPRKSSGSSLRVRFSGSDRGGAHQRWYETLATHYDHLYDAKRAPRSYPFLHDLFRRRGPVSEILDVACGTFAIDLALARRGYRITGRDLSDGMIAVARRNLRTAGLMADLALGDMRDLRLDRTFDALLCLGTAFNYVVPAGEIRATLRGFRRHLREGGLLILDLPNFDAFLDHPENARAEVDYRAPDGTRIAIFTFNEQERKAGIHHARFFTAIQKARQVEVSFSQAPMRIWTRQALADALDRNGFRPLEWWGDLRLGSRYARRTSLRLVSVAERA